MIDWMRIDTGAHQGNQAMRHRRIEMESQDIKTTEELLQYVALHGDETTYSLFSVLLAGHTDDATKRRYFDDLRNRGLIKQEEEAA